MYPNGLTCCWAGHGPASGHAGYTDFAWVQIFRRQTERFSRVFPPVKIAKRPFENYTYRLTKYAYYQNHTAVYSIEPVELIDGALPLRQQRFVEAWAELHTGELDEAWQQLHSGQLPIKIAPLR